MVEQNKILKQENVKKGDFVEIEFTAKVKGGDIFDTNIKSEAEKAGLQIKELNFFESKKSGKLFSS